MNALTQSLEILRITVLRATQILKEDYFELSQNTNWQSILTDIIDQLESNREKLYILKDDLENLATLILLRITTKLEYIKLFELYEFGKKILKHLRQLNLSKALIDGINEFFLTPHHWFLPNKDQSQELLRYQLQMLEATLMKENRMIDRGIAESSSLGQTKLLIPNKIEVKNNSTIGKNKLEITPSTKNSNCENELSFSLLDLEGNFGKFSNEQ